MATARDAADIFGLTPASNTPRPKKKKKVEAQPRAPGINREIQALIGDSVPPINIVEPKHYKKKAPTIRLAKPRHWEMREFQHGGRDDGLTLKHWKRAIPLAARGPVVTPDVEMDEKEPALVEMRFEDEFPSEKWNVKVETQSYTDEQYENDFKSEDWTKEETDYLMDLCRDFDLRWLLIADRYDPPGDAPTRTMESMKLRYYTIAAKMMESHIPASNMNAPEFQMWERMRNFDAKTETLRKSMVEKLFERSKDEADEERILLEELHRITKNEEDFIKLRRELYSRLESAPAIRRTERGEEQSTAAYQTSAGLTALLQTLLAKERKLKRPMPNGEHPQQTPVDQRRGQPNQYSRRDTIDSQTDGPQKKGSTSQPNVRNLTAAEEVKYGVSHPQERLTSGIQFRHQKIDRLTMAKSQVQTSKIQATLAQLGVPNRLVMPTERVCREFERLVESIHRLLDSKKLSEKIANEIKVLEEMKRIRLGLPKPDENADAMEVDTSQLEAKSDAVNESMVDQDAEGEDDDADGEKDETVDESAMQVDEQDEDDAEGEDDDDAEEQSAVADEDDDDVDQSYGDLGKDDDEDEEQEEEGDDDDDVEIAQDSDEEAEDADAADAEDDEEVEANESEADDGSEEEQDQEAEDDDGDAEEGDDGEAEAEASEPEPSRPSSSHSAAARVHKRSASVISDASKAGSNRSALGRKKRR